MRAFLEEYIDIVVYAFCGLILALGSYNIIINVNHSKYINQKIVVRDVDSNFKEYKDNLSLIEIEKNKVDDYKMVNDINKLLDLMKSDGAYRLFPKDNLSVIDLYNLNNYFIDTIINDGWTTIFKKYSDNKVSDDLIKSLINNYEYINKELLNNSNYSFNLKNDLRDEMQEKYNGILNNYCLFSRLILNMVKEMGDIDV